MFKEFIDFSTRLNEESISSYSQLEELKENGILDERINNEVNLENFINSIKDYLNFLFFENSIPHYKKQLLLHQKYDISFIFLSEYILCLYCDNLNAYRNFPLLLKTISDKFNIVPFNQFSIEDFMKRIYSYYNVKESFNFNYNHIYHEVYLPYCMNKELYEEYEQKGYSDETSFVWAEVEAYKTLQLENFKYLDFVSRDYGDGYGFDLLSISSYTNKEVLIEVKSGRCESFSLTEHEHSVMLNSSLNNADYVVFKYYIDSNNKYNVQRLIFNSNTYSFIDLETNEEYSIDKVTYDNNEEGYKVSKKVKVLELK